MSCCEETKSITIYKGFSTHFMGQPLLRLTFNSDVSLEGYKAYFFIGDIVKEYDDITQEVQIDLEKEETSTLPEGLNYGSITVEDLSGHKHPFTTAIPFFVSVWEEGDIELSGYSATITTDIQENTITINIETGGSGTFNHDELIHRDYSDQHPISAITGLEEELRQKEGRAYIALDKIKPYLYNITYANVDYKFAKDYFLTKKPVINAGACSTIRNGNIVGRNYDYNYNESVEFIIRTPRTAGKYATLGVSASVPRLTEEFMESGVYNAESFKLVPFYTVDAINEYGLTASILLVPLDKGQTTGTTPLITKRDEICNLMLVRYIVDNFQTAQEAVEYLRNYVSVYSPQGLADMGYESHFMVSDKTKSYSIEFVNNTLIATDISSKPYMTNFYLDGVTFNEDGTVYTPADVPTHLPSSQGITTNGSGLERFNLIVSNYGESATITGMRSLMNSLKFTNAYLAGTNPQWNTEFVGTWEDFGTFTVDTPASDFTGLKNYIRGVYEQRIRDGKTWQTVHSAVYDLENKTLNLVVQEDGQELEFGFDYYTREEVDKLIADEIEARQGADQTLQNNIDQLSEDLSRAIEDEAEVRQRDDEALAEAIGNEAQARANADTELDNRINAEEQARGLADTSLGGRIDTEITNRQNADTNLQNQIDSLPTSTDVSSAISAHNTSSTAHSDIRTELGEKQPTLVSGTNIKTINSTTLLGSGNVSVATATQGALADTLNTYMADDISASNQIASRQFVNSSISTNTANFIGTFNSVAEMEAYSGTKTNNDYAFVIGTDTAGNTEYNRYKWTTTETPNKWKYEYTLNNSSFTADQWAAIGSKITEAKVNTYDAHVENNTIHVTASDKTNWNGKSKVTIRRW